MKSDKEIVEELLEVLFDNIGGVTGANRLMLAPALNIVKLKVSKMSAEDSNFIVDAIHKISHHIEIETGKLSPYHGIECAQTDQITKL